MQALEALVRDDAGSVTPFKANDSVREVMMACHESMRDEGIVPSIESYHIIVTAVTFTSPPPIQASIPPTLHPSNHPSIYLSIPLFLLYL
jgi:hypothetical protein